MTLLTCSHCCEKGHAHDGDFQLGAHNQGFWCETCDGYSYLHPNSPRHHFTLILETKTGKSLPITKPKIKFKKRLSPYRYPGGKSKVIDYLYQHIQTHKSETLISPFTGGASFELAMLDASVVKNLHLNDLDTGIYAFWSIVKENPDKLISRIETSDPTHADYFYAQSVIKSDYKNTNKLDAAWYTLLVNRLAYSGISKANPLGGRRGSRDQLLSRWNRDALIKRIRHIHTLRDRITVTQTDAVTLIEEAYWNDAATIFIDPPYVNKGKDLYHCFYNEDDHIRLAVLLDSLHHGMSGADILVTYDYHELFETLYETPQIIELGRTYSV